MADKSPKGAKVLKRKERGLYTPHEIRQGWPGSDSAPYIYIIACFGPFGCGKGFAT